MSKIAVGRLTNKKIEAAIRVCGGNVSDIARATGYTRSAIYNRIQKSPNLQQALIDERESMVDLAESELKKNVELGREPSIFFTLRCLAKNRGYVEKQQIDMTVSNGDKAEKMAQALGLMGGDDGSTQTNP